MLNLGFPKTTIDSFSGINELKFVVSQKDCGCEENIGTCTKIVFNNKLGGYDLKGYELHFWDPIKKTFFDGYYSLFRC